MAWGFLQEFERKIIHLLSLFYLLIYIAFSSVFGTRAALFVLSFLLIVFLELEYIRIELRAKVPILSFLWKRFKRDKEKNRLGGEVFFLIGVIISLAVFDFFIAATAILMTTFGDFAAALIGKKFGKIKIPYVKEKSVEGSVAELIVDFCIGLIILQNIWIALVMALTATIVEIFSNKLDDNMLIPIFAGFNGQVALIVMNYLL